MERELNENKILFIDDDSITNYLNEFIVKKQLKFSGKLNFCVNGKDAHEYLSDIIIKQNTKELFPSIIFLDINMPELNGFEFMDKYQSFPENIIKETKIIFLTSSINQSDKDKAFSYTNVFDY